MVEWKVYYGDGTTYSDEDGPIENTPRRNVQNIAQVDETVGFHFVNGRDFYWYEDDMWFGGDMFGMYDYLCRDGWKIVLFGRTLSNKEFRDVLRKAKEDPDLPRKSGFYPNERNPDK